MSRVREEIRLEVRKDAARRMLKKGRPVSDIAEDLELPVELIEALAKELHSEELNPKQE